MYQHSIDTYLLTCRQIKGSNAYTKVKPILKRQRAGVPLLRHSQTIGFCQNGMAQFDCEVGYSGFQVSRSAVDVRQLVCDAAGVAVYGAEVDDAFDRRNDAGLLPSVR